MAKCHIFYKNYFRHIFSEGNLWLKVAFYHKIEFMTKKKKKEAKNKICCSECIRKDESKENMIFDP